MNEPSVDDSAMHILAGDENDLTKAEVDDYGCPVAREVREQGCKKRVSSEVEAV